MTRVLSALGPSIDGQLIQLGQNGKIAAREQSPDIRESALIRELHSTHIPLCHASCLKFLEICCLSVFVPASEVCELRCWYSPLMWDAKLLLPPKCMVVFGRISIVQGATLDPSLLFFLGLAENSVFPGCSCLIAMYVF